MKKPSDYSKIQPMSSVFYKSEHEVIARNCVTILMRTGDTWRKLTWEEYKVERIKDGGFSEREREYFDDVIPYIKEDKVQSFSPAWELK